MRLFKKSILTNALSVVCRFNGNYICQTFAKILGRNMVVSGLWVVFNALYFIICL